MLLLYKATQDYLLVFYAVWTGIGAVGTVLVGIVVFKEPATFLNVLF
jgi:quaternary ammonium compound-resistance protein SugE